MPHHSDGGESLQNEIFVEDVLTHLGGGSQQRSIIVALVCLIRLWEGWLKISIVLLPLRTLHHHHQHWDHQHNHRPTSSYARSWLSSRVILCSSTPQPHQHEWKGWHSLMCDVCAPQKEMLGVKNSTKWPWRPLHGRPGKGSWWWWWYTLSDN